MKVKVTLNGTSENPYTKMGLTQNPFPAIPRAEYARANRMLAELEAGPLADEADIRRILAGCTEEFISLCCSQYRPGRKVSFNVEFPE